MKAICLSNGNISDRENIRNVIASTQSRTLKTFQYCCKNYSTDFKITLYINLVVIVFYFTCLTIQFCQNNYYFVVESRVNQMAHGGKKM